MHVQILFVIYVVCHVMELECPMNLVKTEIMFNELGQVLQHLQLVTSADKIDFWERPKYDTRRRVVEDPGALLSLKNNLNKDNKLKFRQETTLDLGDNTKKTKVSVKKVKLKHKRHSTRFYYDGNDLSEETTKWPKIQQHKKKGRNDEVRSTRVIPLYLMQQSAEHGHEHEHEHGYEHGYEHGHEHDEKKHGEEHPYDSKQELDPNDETGKAKYFKIKYSLNPYSIKQQMKSIVNDFHEANITVEVIGRTVEYNDIVILKVTERKSDLGKYFRADDSKYVDDVPEKKIIFIVHGLSVMGITDVPCLSSVLQLKILLSYYFAFLDKFDIFIIPMANPDGFVMRNTLWNKNMSPQHACPGVALDRNFDVAWNTTTSHRSSCSQHFPGPNAFSEPETKAIREVLHQYSHKIHGFFHVHSGSYDVNTFKGDAVLYPKGYTDVQTDDDKYIDLRGEIDEAMKNASFQVISVTVDTIHNWYGKVYGSSVDYASSVYGVPYAMELVMQPFKDDFTDNNGKLVNYSLKALNEIWKRIIDVIFNNIWRNAKHSDT